MKKVRDMVKAADGTWLFTPEYNYSIPGTVKNLLDWLSRPLSPVYGENDTAIQDKISTSSGVSR